MIFATLGDGKTMLLMLTEKDVHTMRKGHTVFVDQRHTGGALFHAAVAALYPTNEAAVADLRKYGNKAPDAKDLPVTDPLAGEVKCPGCDGIKKEHELYKGKCIICWYDEAQWRQTMSN